RKATSAQNIEGCVLLGPNRGHAFNSNKLRLSEQIRDLGVARVERPRGDILAPRKARPAAAAAKDYSHLEGERCRIRGAV
ncbi:MAG: hypothetical protein WBX25_36695, partial [Rhodomicrobium sp.]